MSVFLAFKRNVQFPVRSSIHKIVRAMMSPKVGSTLGVVQVVRDDASVDFQYFDRMASALLRRKGTDGFTAHSNCGSG